MEHNALESNAMPKLVQCYCGLRLSLNQKWRDEFSELMTRENVVELSIGPDYPVEYGLGFLKRVPTISGFYINNLRLKSLEGIESLTNLTQIDLSDYSDQSVDFSCFPNLQGCRLEFNKSRSSVFSLSNLKRLELIHYPYRDLTPLVPLTNLRSLSLSQGSLQNIDLIREFHNLEELRLNFFPKLANFQPISSCTKITWLDLDRMKGLCNLGSLNGLVNLRQLDISNCGKIQSLAPLKEFSNLEVVRFIENTFIEDGDVRALLELPNLKVVRFMNRKDYNLRREEFPGYPGDGRYIQWTSRF